MCRHVTRDHCPCADDGAFADVDAWEDGRASADEGMNAHADFPSEGGARSNVHPVGQVTAVIDGCARVDDHRTTQACACTYCRHGKHLAAIAERGVIGNERTRMNYSQERIPARREPSLAIEAITTMCAADRNDCSISMRSFMDGLPLCESRFPVQTRHALDGRCDVPLVRKHDDAVTHCRQGFP
jgi:hypothetical protein